MDFSVIFQLRDKKFWWMDVILYFVISALIATAFCYVVFLIENNIQTADIQRQTVALQTVGTDQQKSQESEVLNYRNKINDFTTLLKNHEFASNVFAFMQAQTMPNIWFNQFILDERNNEVKMSGESDDMDGFSRQVVSLEKNKYIKSIETLGSSLGKSSRIEFSLGIVLDQGIFSYNSDNTLAALNNNASPANQTGSSDNLSGPAGANANSPISAQQPSQSGSSEKLITSFDLLSNPEVIGVIDEKNYIITLNVPNGTNVKTLSPSIVTSPTATVSPLSNTQQDFTNPVTYTVTAQDGSVQNYEAKVVFNAATKANGKSNQSGSMVLIIVVLVGVVIVAIVALVIFIWRKSRWK